MEYYKNVPYDFTVYLPESLKFRSRQHWQIGLAEIQYTISGETNTNMIEIYSDVFSTSIIHDKKKPIVRKITIQNPILRAVTLHKNFNPILYIPINKNDVRQIRVFIRTHLGKAATFITGVTKCTFHIKYTPKGNI
jgi:hypothetical protein